MSGLLVVWLDGWLASPFYAKTYRSLFMETDAILKSDQWCGDQWCRESLSLAACLAGWLVAPSRGEIVPPTTSHRGGGGIILFDND